MGSSNLRIMFRGLLPNAMAPIVVAATLNVAKAILLESYVSFLGYGIQPPTPSWGNMLNNAQIYLTSAPWLAILPGLAITLAVTSFNFVGDGLRDALDPRMDPVSSMAGERLEVAPLEAFRRRRRSALGRRRCVQRAHRVARPREALHRSSPRICPLDGSGWCCHLG
jgi:hypothetical protein